MNNAEVIISLNKFKILRGKKDLIKMFIFLMFMEAIVPYLILYISGFKTITVEEYIFSTLYRLAIYSIFFYYIWKGARWARILFASFLIIASFISAIVLMSNDQFLNNHITFFYGILYIVFCLFAGIVLLTAKNIRLFLDYTRESSSKKRKDQFKHGSNYSYDIAISFAGEDRYMAEELSDFLIEKGLTVFYDKLEEHKLVGKNLFTYLQTIYKDSAQFCIILISEHYVKKPWTLHELEQIQARVFEDRSKNDSEYLLPIRIDNTKVPGLNSIIGYISLEDNTIKEISDIVYKKFIDFEEILNTNKSLEKNI